MNQISFWSSRHKEKDSNNNFSKFSISEVIDFKIQFSCKSNRWLSVFNRIGFSGSRSIFLEGYSCDLNVFSKFWVLRGETLSYYKGKNYDSSTHTNCKNLPDNCKFFLTIVRFCLTIIIFCLTIVNLPATSGKNVSVH